MTNEEIYLYKKAQNGGGSSIINEINGVFIDTDNVIDSGSYSGTLTYTATEDCFFTGVVTCKSSGAGITSYMLINGEQICCAINPNNDNQFSAFVKKGQIVTLFESGATTNSYTVYGIQQGSQDTTKNEIYSTEERAVGTWVDGSTIYQKTVNIGKITNTGEKVYTLGIENVDYLVDVRITPLLRANEANLYTLDNYNPSWSAGSYTSVAMNNDPADGLKITIYSGYYTSANDIYVTVQYTKSTT